MYLDITMPEVEFSNGTEDQEYITLRNGLKATILESNFETEEGDVKTLEVKWLDADKAYYQINLILSNPAKYSKEDVIRIANSLR